MIPRLLLLLTFGSLAALIVVDLDPVSTKLQRLIILAAMLGIWLGPVLLSWKRKSARYILLALPLLLIIPFLLPAKPINREALRDDFLRRMISYQGTKYHWGGENGRGIDCSGLPRKALREALFSNGVKSMNGGSLRLFFRQWWNDASAKALAEGYMDFTIPTGESGTIAQMDYAKLQPGDLAVTADRRHILAYLGGEDWIQADPGAGKVTIANGRTSENGWFTVPITTHRWSILTERGL
ncbi:C40 family peptidase [Akkermansiaceae bacterium]|nr:C40 family peptidase [Akkermansiaceae bacterium]